MTRDAGLIYAQRIVLVFERPLRRSRPAVVDWVGSGWAGGESAGGQPVADIGC
jgi:hypothetical protein